MPGIRIPGTDIVFEFPNLLRDEFIPVVEFDTMEYESANGLGHTAGDTEEIVLSTYIDDWLRRMRPDVVSTESRKIKIPI
jgi:hypothetical protein